MYVLLVQILNMDFSLSLSKKISLSQFVLNIDINYKLIEKYLSFPLALLPDQPAKLTVTNVESRSAEISWIDPVNI